tara:strand:+ start:494 stop:625 length:132 start_codon:yes stop_codon:yes gene_type:complete
MVSDGQFLSHLSGDEAIVAASVNDDVFLSHLSGDEGVFKLIVV